MKTQKLQNFKSKRGQQLPQSLYRKVTQVSVSVDRLRVGWLNGFSWALGGMPREQKMLKGHLPRVTYHQVN